MGLSSTHIKDERRRDRLLLLCALSTALLTILGAAGESLGYDRMLKVNTVKTRTHSLLRQGAFYFQAIATYPAQWSRALLGPQKHSQQLAEVVTNENTAAYKTGWFRRSKQ